MRLHHDSPQDHHGSGSIRPAQSIAAAATGIRPFSEDAGRDFEIRTAVGHAVYGAGDIGEILAAVADVPIGDDAAWFQAWVQLARRTAGVAADAEASGHRVTASDAYLRASAYYSQSVTASSALVDESRTRSTFVRQQDAWAGFLRCTYISTTPLQIPYDQGTLTGHLFTPAAPHPGGGVLIAVNGADGSLARMWATAVAPALERGLRVVVFGGPGQQSPLVGHDVPFRPDWENVLTPVFDVVAALDGASPGRVAVYGISQGGFWVARALCFEHRFAAAVVDPGVVDVSTSWTSALPPGLLMLLDTGRVADFDEAMARGLAGNPDAARAWRFRARPFGKQGYGATISEVRRYNIGDLAGRITTPLLILSPDNERFWPGQSEWLAELAPTVARLAHLTVAEGADEHGEPLARRQVAGRMFDWILDRLS